jgi:crotonobetainyl-CoA:carnitine CoA-transferase CaiB-like acyl-CoA transferase
VAFLEEALADPQFAARGMVIRDASGARQYAPPYRVSGHEFALRRAAPGQGEHSAEVLREAGYDDAAIAALVAEGSVRTA